VKLNALEETRKVARAELDALASRSERAAAIERDAEAVIRDYAGPMPEGAMRDGTRGAPSRLQDAAPQGSRVS
jgi:hypothetical protein